MPEFLNSSPMTCIASSSDRNTGGLTTTHPTAPLPSPCLKIGATTATFPCTGSCAWAQYVFAARKTASAPAISAHDLQAAGMCFCNSVGLASSSSRVGYWGSRTRFTAFAFIRCPLGRVRHPRICLDKSSWRLRPAGCESGILEIDSRSRAVASECTLGSERAQPFRRPHLLCQSESAAWHRKSRRTCPFRELTTPWLLTAAPVMHTPHQFLDSHRIRPVFLIFVLRRVSRLVRGFPARSVIGLAPHPVPQPG